MPWDVRRQLLDVHVVAPTDHLSDPQPQHPAVCTDESAVARRGPVVTEEPAGALDHATGLDVVPALVPRADEAPVGVHGALAQVGELVTTTTRHREEIAVAAVAHGPFAKPADLAWCQVPGVKRTVLRHVRTFPHQCSVASSCHRPVM